jgi:hypothetical protein
MIIELQNFVDKDIVEEIKDSVKLFLPKVKNHAYNRDGLSVNITQNEQLKNLDCKINEILSNLQSQILTQRYKPIYESGSSDFEYHLYEAGDVCQLHADSEFSQVNSKSSLIRYASVILHLNTVKNGGELIFPNQNKSIKTESGKIVIFPPYGMYQHYTTPSIENREVIVTWFVYKNINAIQI